MENKDAERCIGLVSATPDRRPIITFPKGQPILTFPKGQPILTFPKGQPILTFPKGRNWLLRLNVISPHLASPEGEGQIQLAD
ncbi:hypothetical protein ST43_02055 [Prevotella pectinovora]|nr:hypothetical protein ST43_02055 [Prevotella pectinovora]